MGLVGLRFCFNTKSFSVCCFYSNTIIISRIKSSDWFHFSIWFIWTFSRVEPGLFECTGWYVNELISPPLLTMPRFLTKTELIENKFPIEKNYREQMNLFELSQAESEFEFYQRSHAVTAAILQMHEREDFLPSTDPSDLHILFVGRVQPNFFSIFKILLVRFYFSTRAIIGDLHTTIERRKSSSSYFVSCHSPRRFLNSN